MMDKNILLLHGWGSSVKKLLPLSEELEKRGWKVFIPKLPGFDNKPLDRPWNLDDYSDYVLSRAQKRFKGRYLLFGHSFGGRVAVKIGLRMDKKLKGLVLCSVAGVSRTNFLKRAVFYVLAKVGKPLVVIPAIAKVWKRLLYKAAREHDYERTVGGVMRETFKKVVAEGLKPIVGKVRIPALILWGKQDKMTPVADAYFLKKTLPKAKLKVFDNQGHKLPYEQPKEIAGEIEKWYQSLV